MDLKIDPESIRQFMEASNRGIVLVKDKQILSIKHTTRTGKTKIAFTYMQHLLAKDPDIAGIVLVPTTTLVNQWKKTI